MPGPNLSPGASTFDLVPPRRPVVGDFNGAAKIDDAQYPPDAQTMPSAAELNTSAKLHVAAGAVLPLLVLSILGGASPTVFGCISAVAAVTPATLTVIRNGAGDVSVTWPANTFPPSSVYPTVSRNAGAAGDEDIVPITNGVRVRTWNTSGVATDASFTVTLY